MGSCEPFVGWLLAAIAGLTAAVGWLYRANREDRKAAADALATQAREAAELLAGERVQHMSDLREMAATAEVARKHMQDLLMSRPPDGGGT